MKGSPGNPIGNLTILLAAMALSFLALEWVVRMTPLSDRLGWSRVPPIAERLGDIAPKRPGEMRIMSLGDSFAEFRDTEGRNFLRFAESSARRDGYNVTVYNLAQAGTGLKDYARTFQDFAPTVDPDIAVFAIYLGNDVLDYQLDILRERQAAPVLSGGPDKPGTVRRIKDFVKKNSILLHFAYRILKQYVTAFRSGFYERSVDNLKRLYGRDDRYVVARIDKVDPDFIEAAKADVINAWDMAFGLVYPDLYVDMLYLKENSLFPTALERFLADIARIEEFAMDSGIELVFVLIPPSLQVDSRYHAYYRKLGYIVSEEMVDEAPLTAVVRAFLDQRGIAYLDVIPPLRARSEEFYMPNDTHFSTEGQRVVGKALYEFLKGRSFLAPTTTP